jgi:protein-tyrosine phosphatase
MGEFQLLAHRDSFLAYPALSLGCARKVIDLHCHILPGIDDGAVGAADSIAMARQAAHDGIEAVCATPHIRDDHDVRIDEIAGRVADLDDEFERQGIPVSVMPGGEVAEALVEGLDGEELRRVALGEGRWILLEPAPGPLTDSLERRVEQLAARGHRCLIAHPERHPAADLADRLSRLVGEGALVQATADFLVRKETASGMLALAERGLIHVLGSDAHSSRFGRPVRLSPALDVLRQVELLGAHVEWIGYEAPRAIIAGRELESPFGPV